MTHPSDPYGGPPPGGPPYGAVPGDAFTVQPTSPWPGAPEPAVTAWAAHVPLRLPRWGFGDAWIALIGALGLSIVAGVLTVLFVPSTRTGTNIAVLLALAAQWLPMAGWPWLATTRRGNGPTLDLGWRITWSDVGWGLLGGLATLVLAMIIGSITTLIFGEFSSAAGDLVDDFADDRVLLWVLVLSIAFVAPVVEELCFRGLFWGALAKRGVNPYWVTFWTAMAFACFHLEPVRLPLLLGTGLVLGLLRQKTGRLGAPVIAHMVNNSVAAVGIFFV